MMGVAAVDFGWTAAEFWYSTPHEWWSAWELIQARNKAQAEA